MNIDNLNERYLSLLNDTRKELVNIMESFGGSFHFIMEGNPILEEIDDLSEVGLPLVDAYTYNYGNQGNYYVTSIKIGEYGLEIYGVDENNCLSIEDEVLLDHIPIAGMLDIIENLPEIAN